MATDPSPQTDLSSPPRRGRSWGVGILALALVWSALIRVPMVENASAHLDSDLAVDGLTLADALAGHWRWHYPGTPHLGIVPVLLSYVPARIWGANPATLVSGGAFAHLLIITTTFLLAWVAFSRATALGSLVPLTFASTGLIWLSGRITGGHLAVVSWYGVALALAVSWVRKPSPLRTLILGTWCGLGLYVDWMFVFALVGILAGLMVTAPSWRLLARDLPALALGLALGFLPAIVGSHVDPHDSYGEQFISVFQPINPKEGSFSWRQGETLLGEHSRILLEDCVPRLMAGHRLFGLAADPSPGSYGGRPSKPLSSFVTGLAAVTTGLALLLFIASLGAVVARTRRYEPAISRAVAISLTVTTALVCVAFILNRNIFNSDNYRYLVLLIPTSAIGCGLVLAKLWAWGRSGRAGAVILTMAFALLMSWDTATWYAGFGWLGGHNVGPKRDPALAWLREHPEVDAIQGPYWDVYRLAFLVDRPLRAVPLPGEPSRFPEWSRAGRPRVLLVRPDARGWDMVRWAQANGGTELERLPNLAIWDVP